eukprot:406161-Prymnesium_polylepis.1
MYNPFDVPDAWVQPMLRLYHRRSKEQSRSERRPTLLSVRPARTTLQQQLPDGGSSQTARALPGSRGAKNTTATPHTKVAAPAARWPVQWVSEQAIAMTFAMT